MKNPTFSVTLFLAFALFISIPIMSICCGLRYQILCASLMLVVIGLVLSLIISRNSSQPLQQFIDSIQTWKETASNHTDAPSPLANAATPFLQKETDLTPAPQQKTCNIREHYLLELLCGNETAVSQTEWGSVNFSASWYLCILIAIDHFTAIQSIATPKLHHSIKDALLFQLKTRLSDFCCDCAGLSLENERLVVIINSPENSAACFDAIYQICTQLNGLINQLYPAISLSIGIGSFHAGPGEVRLSYLEAQEALKQKYRTGLGRVHSWQPSLLEKHPYYYPLALEKHLLNQLELGQSKSALQTIADLITELKNQPDVSHDNLMQIINQLLGNTLKYLVESHIQISDIFGAETNIYQALSAQETLDEAGFWLSEIHARIFAFLARRNSQPQNHIAVILNYIHQNYRRDFDIHTLAEQVGLSYSHVRKIFVDAMGENIVDYINHLRISEAKQLLTQTNMSINTIALSLGYNNSQSFNRFFKKYEGITPSEFRCKQLAILPNSL